MCLISIIINKAAYMNDGMREDGELRLRPSFKADALLASTAQLPRSRMHVVNLVLLLFLDDTLLQLKPASNTVQLGIARHSPDMLSAADCPPIVSTSAKMRGTEKFCWIHETLFGSLSQETA